VGRREGGSRGAAAQGRKRPAARRKARGERPDLRGAREVAEAESRGGGHGPSSRPPGREASGRERRRGARGGRRRGGSDAGALEEGGGREAAGALEEEGRAARPAAQGAPPPRMARARAARRGRLLARTTARVCCIGDPLMATFWRCRTASPVHRPGLVRG